MRPGGAPVRRADLRAGPGAGRRGARRDQGPRAHRHDDGRRHPRDRLRPQGSPTRSCSWTAAASSSRARPRRCSTPRSTSGPAPSSPRSSERPAAPPPNPDGAPRAARRWRAPACPTEERTTVTPRTRRARLVPVLAAVSLLALAACTERQPRSRSRPPPGGRAATGLAVNTSRRPGPRPQHRVSDEAIALLPDGMRRGRHADRRGGRLHRTAELPRRRQQDASSATRPTSPSWSPTARPGPGAGHHRLVQLAAGHAVRRGGRGDLQRHGHRGAQGAVRLLLLPRRPARLVLAQRRLRADDRPSRRTSPA